MSHWGLHSLTTAALPAVGLFHPLRDARRARRFTEKSRREIDVWGADMCPSPPPKAVKHALIRRYAQQHATRTLVENYIREQRPGATFVVQDDLICISPV